MCVCRRLHKFITSLHGDHSPSQNSETLVPQGFSATTFFLFTSTCKLFMAQSLQGVFSLKTYSFYKLQQDWKLNFYVYNHPHSFVKPSFPLENFSPFSFQFKMLLNPIFTSTLNNPIISTCCPETQNSGLQKTGGVYVYI